MRERKEAFAAARYVPTFEMIRELQPCANLAVGVSEEARLLSFDPSHRLITMVLAQILLGGSRTHARNARGIS